MCTYQDNFRESCEFVPTKFLDFPATTKVLVNKAYVSSLHIKDSNQ